MVSFIFSFYFKHIFIIKLNLALGAVPSPFDCYLVLRGLKTLPLRMKQHMDNAVKVATWLESNPKVEKVLYPRINKI